MPGAAKARARMELAGWEPTEAKDDVDMAHIHPDDPFHDTTEPDDRSKVRRVISKAKPTRKVTGATLGAAVAVIVGWVLSEYTNLNLPAEVDSAVTIVLTFLGGWLPTERA